MFKRLKNIESSFQYIRINCLVTVVSSFIFCAMLTYQHYKMIGELQSHIYILASGKALEAFASDRKENLSVEAKDHISRFHEFYFTLDPDERVIQGNLSKALYLADESAKRQSDNLRETGYYANIISGNISQRIQIDSINLNMQSLPFYFRCYATLSIIRTTSIVTRSLVTEGYLRNVNRSENNPHGFLVERWSVLENKDLKTETR